MTRGLRAGVAHRLTERDEISFHGTFSPRGVHREHGEHAVAVLLGDQQRITAQHQIPTHGRVARGVRSTVPNPQPPQGSHPAATRIAHIQNQRTFVGEEQVFVFNESLLHEPRAELQISLQDRSRTRTELNASIVAGLRTVQENVPTLVTSATWGQG